MTPARDPYAFQYGFAGCFLGGIVGTVLAVLGLAAGLSSQGRPSRIGMSITVIVVDVALAILAFMAYRWWAPRSRHPSFLQAFAVAFAIIGLGGLTLCSGALWGAFSGVALASPVVTAPTQSIPIGTVRFDKYGPANDPAPALILIPALSMSAWEWQSTIGAFATDRVIYAATIAGFDGTTPASPPYLQQADAAVMKLVAQEQLKRPVLVGHGFGGHLALRLMEEHPDAFAGAVIVDQTPFFPPLQAGQTVEQRAQSIASFTDGIVSAPDWLYQDQLQSTIATMVTDTAQAQNVAAHSLRSDRATVAGAMSEMSLEDLRPNLGTVTAPLLVIAPVSSQAPYMNDRLRALTPDQLTATVRNYYASEYAGARNVTVQTIANSKDFVMLDQPDALNAAIKNFLSTLPAHP
ncbi:MAG: alpha/beta hydrolase [Candidatus Eremiobacteraeota bacterium]|nr:alpha/beta hydrolase [Candidatus Eremiobacteraeota bacterium]MBV8281499.1 alpha/beta hydrolase [Candidatus Eremiobacteraeota bacterium]